MHAERGTRLFRVPYNPKSAYWLAGGAILLTVPWIIDAYRHDWAMDKIAFAAIYLVLDWEGDVLTVVPSPTLIAGGKPLTGGSVKVPKARRAEVERLQAQAAAAP